MLRRNNSTKRWQNTWFMFNNHCPSCYAIIEFFHATNPPKKWWTTTPNSRRFGVLYLQRLQTLVHLRKCLVVKVSFTPMPSCSNSFSIFSCGKNVAYHGQKNHGPTCYVKSCIYNNNVYKFWSMDVLWWCGHFYFGYQIFEWHLGAHAYYCEDVWSEWGNQVIHGYTEIWFVTLGNCIYKRWRHQFDSYGSNFVFHHWLWTV